MASSVAQQASSVEAAIRILAGASKPSPKEKAYLVEKLRDAASTLRAVERAAA